MLKIETIWHHLLYSALKKKQFKFTQKYLAELFGYSISTVNHSLKELAKIGAIRKESKFFVLTSFEKLLYYWASVRKFEKDIIYQTNYPANVLEIEGLLPARAVYACYSAARQILKESPADYNKVYFYLPQEDLTAVKKRFPQTKTAQKTNNLCILKMPEAMKQYGPITTLPQTFVDIWNLRDWYARDFLQGLKEKLYGVLS